MIFCKVTTDSNHRDLYCFEHRATVGVLIAPFPCTDIQGLGNLKSPGETFQLRCDAKLVARM